MANDLSLPASRRSMRATMGMENGVPEGGARCVTVDQRPYALFKVGGKVYCLDNHFPPLGGPPAQRTLHETIVRCPRPGSRFDVASGNVVGTPARKPVLSYPVAIE